MAADNQSLKIIEVCRVSPPPNSTYPNSLPLTFFDLVWLKFPPVQRLFFYQISSTDPSFLHTILPKLKSSLSTVLHYYLPLAGNLLWPNDSYKPFVKYVTGDAVLLTVAESNADFHHLSGDGFRDATSYHHLLPQLPESDERIAVISLQVTMFKNMGFSIGIASHHAILDGKTSTSFMKSWARVCKLDVAGVGAVLETELAQFYDRKVIDDSLGFDESFAKEWEDVEGPNRRRLKVWTWKTPPNSIRATFKLNRHSLQKLKQWVLNHKTVAVPVHLSSFTVATAFLWVCAAKTEGLKDGKMHLIFAVDARSRLQPPLPANYFGNCLVCQSTFVERNQLVGENGVFVATEAISEGIKGLEEGALKGAEKWVSLVKSANSANGPSGIGNSIGGSPRFEVYSADFGWGRPKKVEIASIDATGAFAFTDSRNGDGGIEIGLVRERDEMERFAALFTEGLEALSNY